MSGIPVPKPCKFLEEAEHLGAFNGSKRWKNKKDGRIYTWDSLHGEIEVFNSRGRHLGVMDCDGNMIKEAVKGRKIDV